MKNFKNFIFIALLPCMFGSCEMMKPKNGSKKVESKTTDRTLRREVTCVKKDKEGTITSLGGEWGIVSLEEAIEDLKSGAREYYIIKDEQEVSVILVPAYIRASANETEKDNLSELPECE